MCGIAGIISKHGAPVDSSLLARMIKVINHRGPDDEGYVLVNQHNSEYRCLSGPKSNKEIKQTFEQIHQSAVNSEFNIGLGHCRFSIIDLTNNGHQPFFDHEHRCCIVFNGEIYNYVEIRNKLKSLGSKFYTQSDTEVVVEAYKKWGHECLHQFNGMWAFAIYDLSDKTLFLTRDRLGKSPLYWVASNDRFWFASEIKSLLQVPERFYSHAINESKIYGFLVQGYRDIDNTTLFEKINTLPAGTWCKIGDKLHPEPITYWQIPKKRLRESEISVDEAARSVRELLLDAVRIRLRCDVPLCIELSGGMDSSTLLSLASQISKEPIKAFTVSFPDKQWNEVDYAKSVARHCGVEHQIVDIPPLNIWQVIEKFTYLEEEPYHSPNLYTNQLLRIPMREQGYKVLLNGAAGDELFAGYGAYFPLAVLEMLFSGEPIQAIKNITSWSSYSTKFERVINTVKLICTNLGRSVLSDKFDFLRITRRSIEKDSFVHATRPRMRDWAVTLSGRLKSDLVNTKIPYWLRSGEKTIMGIPMEGRAPFLDYRVVELAFKLPVQYLVRDGWHKWILRKAMEGLLPADVLWRKNKLGFPFPYERFFSESDSVIQHILTNSNNPYLNYSNIATPKKMGVARYWRIISFILWYEYFINGNKELFNKIADINCNGLLPNIGGYIPEYLRSV